MPEMHTATRSDTALVLLSVRMIRRLPARLSAVACSLPVGARTFPPTRPTMLTKHVFCVSIRSCE